MKTFKDVVLDLKGLPCIHIGVIGSYNPPSEKQTKELISFMNIFKDDRAICYHGDNMGVDGLFHKLAYDYHEVHIHPSTDDSIRGHWCKNNLFPDIFRIKRKTLVFNLAQETEERNKVIVSNINILLLVPSCNEFYSNINKDDEMVRKAEKLAARKGIQSIYFKYEN